MRTNLPKVSSVSGEFGEGEKKGGVGGVVKIGNGKHLQARSIRVCEESYILNGHECFIVRATGNVSGDEAIVHAVADENLRIYHVSAIHILESKGMRESLILQGRLWGSVPVGCYAYPCQFFAGLESFAVRSTTYLLKNEARKLSFDTLTTIWKGLPSQ